MNLLAIETATTACAIGVRARDTVVVRVLDEQRRHTEFLAPGIDALLAEVGLGPRDLDRIVVDRGPGLYTGLRVGLATAGALAQALGCDLVGVTSLELWPTAPSPAASAGARWPSSTPGVAKSSSSASSSARTSWPSTSSSSCVPRRSSSA